MFDLILLLALLSGSGVDDSSAANPSEPVNHFQLEVFALDPAGEDLPGVQLSLCLLGSDESKVLENEILCQTAFTLWEGRGVFKTVPRGRYRLTARMSGCADTTVSPLNIGGNPRPPSIVKLIMTPVVYDCPVVIRGDPPRPVENPR